MSTGSGKSAIYQIAGLLLDGPTIVVSPLISLQEDQMDAVAGVARRRRGDAELHALARRARAGSRGPRRTGASSSCSSRRSSWRTTRSRTASRRRTRRCSSWTRRTACRSGATTSAPSTCASPRHRGRSGARRSWRSRRPRRRPSAPTSCRSSRCGTRSSSCAGSTGRRSGSSSSATTRPSARRARCWTGSSRTLPGPGIVYATTQRETEELALALAERGVRSGAYHGGHARPAARGDAGGVHGRRARST